MVWFIMHNARELKNGVHHTECMAGFVDDCVTSIRSEIKRTFCRIKTIHTPWPFWAVVARHNFYQMYTAVDSNTLAFGCCGREEIERERERIPCRYPQSHIAILPVHGATTFCLLFSLQHEAANVQYNFFFLHMMRYARARARRNQNRIL